MNFPKKEDYEKFIHGFSGSLPKDSCFYLYGSFIRGSDFTPGRSDLDGGIILDVDFITPFKTTLQIAKSLRHFLFLSSPPNFELNPNFNLMTRGINREGRFLAYDDAYTDYLKENAQIVTGPDFVSEMNGMNYKRECLRSAAYNLRKVRNGLLTYFYDIERNPDKAKKTVLSSIGVLWSMPKKLLESLGKRLQFEQGAFIEPFMDIFPDYDFRDYDLASRLRKDPKEYFGVLEDRDNAFLYGIDFLNATEAMIKAYVERVPFPTKFEVNAPTRI